MNVVSTLAAGIYAASNGTAEIYVRGTSSRATYYTAFGGTGAVSSGANITLDAYGSAVVYVDQLVDVTVRNQSGTIVRQFTEGHGAPSVEVVSDAFTGTDYVTGASATSEPTNLKAVLDKWDDSAGADDWKVLYRGVATNLQNALAAADIYFNVKASVFGAVGDGTTDDTASITSAMTAAAIVGGVVFFPPGTYKVTSAITLPANVSMLGCGPNSTKISIAHATANTISMSTGGRSIIRDLWFAPSQANTGYLITVAAASRLEMYGCRMGDTTYTNGRCLNFVTGAMTKGDIFGTTFEHSTTVTTTEGFIWTTGQTHRVHVVGCRFVMPNVNYTLWNSGCGLYFSSCTVDFSAITGATLTSTFVAPFDDAGGITGVHRGSVINSTFQATAGGIGWMALLSTGAETNADSYFVEDGNTFETGVVPWTFAQSTAPVSGHVFAANSRLGRIAYVADGDIANLSTASRYNETVVYTRTTNAAGAFTITLNADTPDGAPLSLIVWVNGAGANQVVTFAGDADSVGTHTVNNNTATVFMFRRVILNTAQYWVIEGTPLAGLTP